MLEASPEVDLVRHLVGKRLMDSHRIEAGQKALDRMLLTLWRAGYVTLEPPPPVAGEESSSAEAAPAAEAPAYRPQLAYHTEQLPKLLQLRGVNPLYGVFVANQLGIADQAERIQAIESILEIPSSVAHFVRVPGHDILPPGPLATTRLDVQLLQLGLATPEELGAVQEAEEEQEERPERRMFAEERPRVLHLADKLKMLFDYDFPAADDVRIQPVWAAGELLEYGGDFNKYITSKRLQKQEGVIFRHLLRLILLIREFLPLCPADIDPAEWEAGLEDIADRVTSSCRDVDATSTDRALEESKFVNDVP
jgi:hypothetical protein